ncbi:hypothetical protein B9479_007638 [Cryptococcus floricola]|uniref:FAS1 domain-containing protein n=1 Tax=Cryptococcus floricola TaxID=2591691 RepID=A0A5D3AQ11_9TREE|nr:hypothetical protein B9479_007638 [Cryptococcus floricola]
MVHLAALLFLPLALAAPAQDIPELSLNQWKGIQNGLTNRISGLGSWSWNKAEEALSDLGGQDKTELTIWQNLKEDPHSFSKLVKIIEFEGHASKYLDDKDAQITFFAPNNDALTPPHHEDDDDDFEQLLHNPSLASLSAALDRDPSLTSSSKGHDDDDDEEKKRKKEIFRKIAGKVLAYHGLPKAYTVQELGQNSTFATALKADDGSYAGLHRRVRIEKNLVPPSIKLNFYAKIVASDRKARNGYFHALDHPLLPPGSILEELFLFPDTFSTLTSSVQKVHEAHALDYGYDREHSEPGKPKFHGNPLATLFAPSNAAFHDLPDKLKFYLFSPFGEKSLIKLLAYHYIPHTLLLSEAFHQEKHEHKGEHKGEVWTVGDDPSFHKQFKIHTGLPNATVEVEIEKVKVLPIEGATKTTIKVNGEQVEVIDVPARNGAVHVLSKLLVPPHEHHGHHGHHDHDQDLSAGDSWENWEEWFPQWVDAQDE